MSLFCGPCQGLIFFYSSCLLHKVKNEVLWPVCFLLRPFSLASIWSCLHMLVPLCASTLVPLLVCLNFFFLEGHQSDCIRAHFVCMCARSLSWVQLFATPWTLAHQAPPFMKFSSQEYWNGLAFFALGIFLTQASNLCLLHVQADSLSLFHPRSPGLTLTASFNLISSLKALK